VVCDGDGRVLALGRGIFELTGYREPDVIGRDVADALGLSDRTPVATALEWGVRKLGEKLELRTRAGMTKAVVADVFPAYDEDGGLLVALAPR
jgi:PAS domain-containing protein